MDYFAFVLKRVKQQTYCPSFNELNANTLTALSLITNSFTHTSNSLHLEGLLFNSLAPGRCGSNFKCVFSKFIWWINILTTSCGIALRWVSENLTDEESTLVQVMAGCWKATSHYLNHCWHWSMWPYGITRPLWVKSTIFFHQKQATGYVTWWSKNLGISWNALLILWTHVTCIQIQAEKCCIITQR